MSYPIIVIPCHNEERRLNAGVLAEFSLPGERVEFMLVNDGSSDGTLPLLQQLAREQPEKVSVLDLQPNRGKAEAVRQGFLRAFEKNPDFIGFWDADLATPLSEIPPFLAILHERPAVQMVFGSRVKLMGRNIERRATRHYLGRCFATAVSVTLRLSIYDTQCGAKMFRVNDELRQVFAEPFLSRWIFDVEIIARFLQRRKTKPTSMAEMIYEYPLREWRDVAGSKVRPKDFVRAAWELWRIKRRYLT